jgi:hypothetical protein
MAVPAHGFGDAVARVRARIGWSAAPVVHVIDAERVRRWAEAIGDPDPRWRDEVPPTLVASLRPDVWDRDLPEASAYGRQWLNGGDRFSYGRPVRVGERVRVVTRLVGAVEKRGRTGDLLLLDTETTFEDDDGAVVCRIRGTLIRR